MSVIVPNVREALNNVRRFAREVKTSTILQSRLAYARAWYAHRDVEGDWHFGPSKFIGYEGMTAKEYVNEEHRDGRITERQLGQWFTQVPEGTPLHAELDQALRSFLERYGKVPSSLSRINVTANFYAEHVPGGDLPEDRMVADLLIAVARRLPQMERDRVRAAL
ncbi:hypothetical protein FHT00_002927 [Sphingomonas insulae]|uniref:Antitoxin SocA-like Panacea domain-containing protein n=1 Tax=Sphingomonas insulae TaxID=424800 RepID=A0ABP3T3Z3_9SPHN|nr:hypothetical protein [Sphingomonas insulae]NIJ30948.1 hypothetical protein [Sphingomonas insulae]